MVVVVVGKSQDTVSQDIYTERHIRFMYKKSMRQMKPRRYTIGSILIPLSFAHFLIVSNVFIWLLTHTYILYVYIVIAFYDSFYT